MPTYERHTAIDTDPAALFAWHTRPGAFERLAPPWEHLRVLSQYGGIADGGRLTMEIRRGPFTMRWEALHRGFIDGVQFQDVQVSGPFKVWVHTHRVEPAGGGRALLIDRIEYTLPLGPIGAMANVFVQPLLERLFAFRHRRIAADLARHASIGRGRRLRLVLTGRAGFVLGQLAAFFSTGGHLVHVFPTAEDVRVGPSHAAWGPTAVPDQAALEQADAIIHVGLHALTELLESLEARRSRARAVVALPTVAAADQPDVRIEDLRHALSSTSRRVVALLTPGVLAAWPQMEGRVPAESVTPSVDGALVGLDDLLGAVYFAACDDGVAGLVDVTVRRAAATAALPPDAARYVSDVRVLQHRIPTGLAVPALVASGFVPLNATVAATILAEVGASV